MYEPETRVYLDPPLNGIKEIQLLDCNIPKCVLIFDEPQKVFKSHKTDYFTIPSGSYTLKSLQYLFINDSNKPKLLIIRNEKSNFLMSSNEFNVWLSEGLQKALSLPEIIRPGTSCPISIINNKPMKILCNLIDSKYSYSTASKSGDHIKIVPSNLLAVVPSQNYPSLPVQQIRHPIN